MVQCAVKQILEPILEAQFWHVSYGFRPGRGCHGALEHIRCAPSPRARAADGRRYRPPYSWVIEGDIRGLLRPDFDITRSCSACEGELLIAGATKLVLQFLKAGVLTEEQILRTETGTPQGGVTSPLLANIALSAIEERYERWVDHRQPAKRSNAQIDGRRAAGSARRNDRRAGRMVCLPVRYADDFVVLVSGTQSRSKPKRTHSPSTYGHPSHCSCRPRKREIH